MCANVHVCSRQFNAPQKNKNVFSSVSCYITPSFIIHTMFFLLLLLLLNLQVIWQTCATVNVRYFPWGKLGWEGPGTLLAMGLPENKGVEEWRGWGGTRAETLFIGVTHSHHPSQSTLRSPPSTGTRRVALSVHKYTSHTTCTRTENRAPSTRRSLQRLNLSEISQDRLPFFPPKNTHTSLAILRANTHTVRSANIQTVSFWIFV